MAPAAHVTSLEAIDDFRSGLVLYLEKASRAVGDATDEVFRTRIWLQQEQRQHWEGELRRRRKRLEIAEQELFTARFASLRESTTAKQLLVNAARNAVAEAEAKLAALRRWSQRFDSEIEPLAKEVEKLRGILGYDLKLAVADLTHALDALSAYASERPASLAPAEPPPAPASGDPAAPAGGAA